MIISHRHRYLFVELPRTGSTAVRHELRDLYDGETILTKHATYEEFSRVATADELRYFVFSGIRNPLDDVVSQYFKLKTDHRGRYSDIRRATRHKRFLRWLGDRPMFEFIQKKDSDFRTFFLRYYVLPYDTWASVSHRRFDFVMRFEHLADDFEQALHGIGIEPKRRLPIVNSTGEKRAAFTEYYEPDMFPRVRRVVGPYMERWGYEFPSDWQVGRVTTLDRAAYRTFSFFACLYWRHVKPRGTSK